MIIAGAGSAGIETTGICLLSGCNDIVLYDDNINSNDLILQKYHVIKTEEELIFAIKRNPQFCVAIGNPRRRKRVFDKILAIGGLPANVINHSLVCCLSDIPKNGTVIHNGVSISYGLEIGKSCLIHANCTIGHKVKIGNFVNIGPLCSIVGPCEIGDFSYIGAGSTILPHHKIGRNVIVSAGCVVNKNLNDFETFE